MKPRRTLPAALLAGLTFLAALAGRPHVEAASPVDAGAPTPAHPACAAPVKAGSAQCLALVSGSTPTGGPVRPGAAKPTNGAAPIQATVIGNSGAYDPYFLQSAYNFTPWSVQYGHGMTIAVVAAFDDPSAEADLAYYRSFWGLPACTTANGCFKKVNQTGGNSLPPPDLGWSIEISVDLDMLSAVCPNCNLLLVEATSNTFANLALSEKYAASVPGVVAIDNGFGAPEFDGETAFDPYFEHPGIAITAATGDTGFGAEYPSAAPGVTAVGGTTLFQQTNTGSRQATETAWMHGGSGCSAYEPMPWWQSSLTVSRGNNTCNRPAAVNFANFSDDHPTGVGPIACPCRMTADVAAVADPNTPVWMFYGGNWYWASGTSVASPIIAAAYALGKDVDNRQPQFGFFARDFGGSQSAELPYEHSNALFDVTSGSNGACSIVYLCTAGPGFDGPTGIGTPNGIAAFRGSSPQ